MITSNFYQRFTVKKEYKIKRVPKRALIQMKIESFVDLSSSIQVAYARIVKHYTGIRRLQIQERCSKCIAIPRRNNVSISSSLNEIEWKYKKEQVNTFPPPPSFILSPPPPTPPRLLTSLSWWLLSTMGLCGAREDAGAEDWCNSLWFFVTRCLTTCHLWWRNKYRISNGNNSLCAHNIRPCLASLSRASWPLQWRPPADSALQCTVQCCRRPWEAPRIKEKIFPAISQLPRVPRILRPHPSARSCSRMLREKMQFCLD